MARRRLKIGLAVTLVALVTLVGSFYYFYFIGPDAVLERAEAFAFRRMTVAELSEQGSYRFHYVTNRVPGEDPDSLDDRFGSEREGELKFGYFDTHIEPTLGIGMLIDPTEWFQNEEIQIDQVSELDRATFVERAGSSSSTCSSTASRPPGSGRSAAPTCATSGVERSTPRARSACRRRSRWS